MSSRRQGAKVALTALGGMPVAAARATRGAGVVRQPVPRTGRAELMSLLRRKAWQVDDLKRHPVCVGVPLGQNGGEQYGVSVDVGLKSFATVGVSEESVLQQLAATASPDLKRSLMHRALEDSKAGSSGGGAVPYRDLLRRPATVPMAVHVKEDLMSLPIASALNPAALQARVSDEKLDLLSDPFFRANPPSSELVDLVVEGVPGADKHAAAKDEYRREQRAAFHSEMAASGRGGRR